MFLAPLTSCLLRHPAGPEEDLTDAAAAAIEDPGDPLLVVTPDLEEWFCPSVDEEQARIDRGAGRESGCGDALYEGECEPRPPLGGELRSASHAGALAGDLPLCDKYRPIPTAKAEQSPQDRGRDVKGHIADQRPGLGWRGVPEDVAFGDAHMRRDGPTQPLQMLGVDLDRFEGSVQLRERKRERSTAGGPLDQPAIAICGEPHDRLDDAVVPQEVLAGARGLRAGGAGTCCCSARDEGAGQRKDATRRLPEATRMRRRTRAARSGASART